MTRDAKTPGVPYTVSFPVAGTEEISRPFVHTASRQQIACTRGSTRLRLWFHTAAIGRQQGSVGADMLAATLP